MFSESSRCHDDADQHLILRWREQSHKDKANRPWLVHYAKQDGTIVGEVLNVILSPQDLHLVIDHPLSDPPMSIIIIPCFFVQEPIFLTRKAPSTCIICKTLSSYRVMSSSIINSCANIFIPQEPAIADRGRGLGACFLAHFHWPSSFERREPTTTGVYLVAMALVIALFRPNSFFLRSSGLESSTSSCCMASDRASSILALLPRFIFTDRPGSLMSSSTRPM